MNEHELAEELQDLAEQAELLKYRASNCVSQATYGHLLTAITHLKLATQTLARDQVREIAHAS